MDDVTSKKKTRGGGRSGPLQRITAVDMYDTREALSLLYHAMEPEDRTQRQAFHALMPDLYIIRNKGFSFAQITSMLVQIGFKLQLSSVRMYYYEMLKDSEIKCAERMNEQLLLMSEIRKETHGVVLNNVCQKVLTIANHQHSQSEDRARVADVLGIGPSANNPVMLARTPPPATAMPPTEPEQSATPLPEVEPIGDYGLLGNNTRPDSVPATRISSASGFFDMPDDPIVPNLSPTPIKVVPANIQKTAAASPHEKIGAASPPILSPAKTVLWNCLGLQPDVVPVNRRDGVPDAVYVSDEIMEHPAIPGLMLTKEQRIYGAYLEISDNNGVVRLETPKEKPFRLTWKKAIPMEKSKTSDAFVEMNLNLFKKQG